MKKILTFIIILLATGTMYAQIMYQFAGDKSVGVGSYGRIGADWSFENGGSIGRRLNLNNMGSIGGRMEEQDYLELASSIGFKPFSKNDSTKVYVQFRVSVYSESLSLIGNSSTSSLGGLTMALPEIFLAAENISNSGVNVWVGSRLYRGPDVHIADHFYFNDHSGQGFGIEYKGTRFAGIFVASTDTNASVPPYFYLNIGSGTPSTALRQRSVWILEQDLKLNPTNTLTFLGEYHRLGDADADIDIPDTLPDAYNYPSDKGFVLGARLTSELSFGKTSYNRLALRYGAGIANGGDGGMSRTWLTFGAPDLDNTNFKGAYSTSIVDEFFIQISPRFAFNCYLIYTQSKGAASTNGLAETYWGREVYNRKDELAIGFRESFNFNDKFRLIGEAHYAQRKDGDNPYAQTFKLSVAPTLVPTGNREYWARPEIRFVTSVAFYNSYAQEALYSPYLEFVGPKKVGYYFGIKAEWWIW